MNSRKPWHRYLFILAGLLVAYALRVHRLGAQNVWWDEGLSVLAARESFVGATLWTAADVHPPLYFWLLWGWTRLAGQSEFALRYVTLMESMLMVAAMLPLGLRLTRRRSVGVVALWLLGLSRFHIWWTQEMRMYILAGLCSMLALYFTVRLADGRFRRSAVLGWIAAMTGAFYTIYASIVLVPITNLFMLVVGLRREERWRFWGRWILVQLPVALLMIPWLLLALPRMRSWSVVEEPARLSFVFQLNAVLLTLGISTDIGRYVVPALMVLAVLVGGLMFWFRRTPAVRSAPRSGESIFLLTLALLLPPLTIWLLSQPRTLFYNPRVEARYLLPFAPAFYLLLAWGLEGWLRSRLRPVGLALLVAVGGLFVGVLPQYYATRYLRDDYATLTRIIWAHGEPEDVVVLVAGSRYPLFLNYYDRPPAREQRPAFFEMPGEAHYFDADYVDDVLSELSAAHDRIWLAQVEQDLQDPERLVERWLAERYARRLSFTFEHNRLTLFAEEEGPITAEGFPPQHTLEAMVAPGVELLGFDLLTQEFRPLDALRPALYFRVTQPATLTLALEGRDGQEVARQQLALEPLEGIVRRQLVFGVTPYTPAQPYRFVLEGPGERVAFGEARVTHTEPPVRIDHIPQPHEARLGEEIRLLGYRLEGTRRGELPTVRAGETLALTLYWQPDEPPDESYTVFTHLVGTTHNPRTQGPLWAQDDQIPLEGDYPTTHWLPGIPLADAYTLELDPETPPGDYQLLVGMYRTETGERLPVAGTGADPGSRHIRLGILRVSP